MLIGAIEMPELTEDEKQEILENECYRQENERDELNNQYTYDEGGFCDGFTKL